MGSESALWTATRDRLAEYGELTRFEPSIVRGIPDVYYALLEDHGDSPAYGQGWLELKHVHAAPKRPRTPVRYKYRAGQVEFLARHWRLRGHAYVLAQVGKLYLLHNGDAPSQGVGVNLPLDKLQATARMVWGQPWNAGNTLDLLDILTQYRS